MEVYARVRRAIQVDGMSQREGGGAAVRAGAQDDPEDVGVFDSAGLRAEETGGEAQARALAGNHR